MGFFSSIADFLAKPIVGTIGSIATGLLGQKGAYRDWETDRKSTRLNSSHRSLSRMPSSA